jgi:hypothetical protein
MGPGFELITNLQYKVKGLEARVRAFESGEKYAALRTELKARLAGKEREIRGLKAELAGAYRQTAAQRHEWWGVFEDTEKEHEKELARKDSEIKKMEERALRAERQRDDLKDRLKEKALELYQVKTELEDERGKGQKLLAQINRDYENSSLPSSRRPNHKKIANNRAQTGKKPGGQPGHKGHGRKALPPTSRINIPAPEEYMSGHNFTPTGKIITKQSLNLSVNLIVDEYATPEFRDARTRQRVHADFPEGVVNDVNYGGSVRAFAYLLNNYCNVSVGKVSDFLAELTGGKLRISTGMINGLSKKFSQKTAADQKRAFADLLLSPVMNVDFTSARVNGKNMNVLVCATPSTAMYLAREHKGHEGVKDSPVESYQRALIHDHDITFYSYGRYHQECLEHVLRYLKDSLENETGLQWNRLMRELIREMIHFRNGLDPEDGRNPDEVDPERVKELEARYDEILGIAEREYEYEPPNKYYLDGFKLSNKLRKYRDNHLLFLHDIRVSPTNNLAERLLRVFKRKLAQVMTFRSFDGLDYLCQSMGVVASSRALGQNLFESVAATFDRPLPDNSSAIC